MTTSLAKLDSGATLLPAAERIDPYWLHDTMWGRGSRAYWRWRAMVERDNTIAPNGRKFHTITRTFEPQPVALEGLIRSGTRQPKLAILAAIIMWQTATTEQLSAITGVTPTQTMRALNRLWDAGVIEEGNLGMTDAGRVQRLWRIHPGKPLAELCERLATTDEWVSVTGGIAPTAGVSRMGDRHNTLATELALRCAEFLPTETVGTVWGERFTARDLLAPHMAEIDPVNVAQTGQRSTVAGDGMLVRADGLRVVFEITGGRTDGIADKMHRWMKVLASRPVDDLGLHVVFVEADVPGTPSTDKWRMMRSAFEKALRSGVGGAVQRERIHNGMSLARWADWFDGPWTINAPAFARLRAERATGPIGENRWSSISILDDVVFAPKHPAVWQAPIDNAHGIWGIPHWLRVEELRHVFGPPTV